MSELLGTDFSAACRRISGLYGYIFSYVAWNTWTVRLVTFLLYCSKMRIQSKDWVTLKVWTVRFYLATYFVFKHNCLILEQAELILWNRKSYVLQLVILAIISSLRCNRNSQCISTRFHFEVNSHWFWELHFILLRIKCAEKDIFFSLPQKNRIVRKVRADFL